MSGFFDWHVTAILAKVWREELVPSPELFVSLFADADGVLPIPASVIEGWHALLTPGTSLSQRAGHIRFNRAFSPDTPVLPQISIAMSDERDEKQPLAYEGPQQDGYEVVMMMLRESVEITMTSPHPDATTAMYIVVRGIMMSHVTAFERLGYSGLNYLGGGDLMPLEELMPGASQTPQLATRSQRWQTITEPRWKLGAFGTGTPFVHAADVTVGGIDGGVETNYTGGPVTSLSLHGTQLDFSKPFNSQLLAAI